MPDFQIPPADSKWRGVNLLQDPRQIGDDELTQAINCAPTKPGILSKRLTIGSPRWTNTGFASAPALGAWPVPFPGNAAILGFTKESATQGGLNLYGPQGSGTLLTLNQLPKRRPGVAFFNGKAYVATGQPPQGSYMPGGLVASKATSLFTVTPTLSSGALGTFSGVAFLDKSGNLADPNQGIAAQPTPAVIANYRQRLVFADFGPGFENYLVFSDSLFVINLPVGQDPLVTIGSSPLAANGRNSIIGGSDRIVAMVEVMLTAVGSPVSTGLLVLKKNDAFLITGEPNQTTDNATTLGTLQIQHIAFNCGCASAETIVRTPYGVIWAGPDDVWMFNYGQVPVRIGSKIRPALQATAPQLQYKWHAAYFGGFYRLACFSSTQDQNEFAPCQDQWWLDLRDGPPQGTPGESEAHEAAVWWGPQRFLIFAGGAFRAGTMNMLVEGRPDQPPALYGLEVVALVTDQLTVIQYDTGIGFDVPGTVQVAVAGGEVVMDLTTKEFELGDPALNKMFMGIDVDIWMSTTAQIKLDAIMDGGANTDTESNAYIMGLRTWPLKLDGTGPYDTAATNPFAPMARRTQGVAFRPLNANRILGRTQQYRIYDAPGYYIDQATNGQLRFITNSGGIKTWVALVPSGFYADLKALLDAIVVAMNAATASIGVTFTHNVGSSGTGSLGVAITVSASTFAWQLIGTSQAMSNAINSLLSTLGYDTTNGFASIATQTGSYTVLAALSPAVELARFTCSYELIPRRPT